MDIPTVVTKKMLKAAMKHIEVIAKARQKGNVKTSYAAFSKGKYKCFFMYICYCIC